MQRGIGDGRGAEGWAKQDGDAGTVGGGEQSGAMTLVGVGVGVERHGRTVARSDVDVDEERGAVAAGEPGSFAEGEQGGVDAGGLVAGDEVEGPVTGALLVVFGLVGHAVEVGEAGEQAGCGGPERGNAGIIEQGWITGDFGEDLGEACCEADGAAAEVHSGGDSTGFVEAGGLRGSG